MMRHARATAPVRLDFAGGWTDVPPFSAREGGAVVSAALALTAEAEVLPGGTGLRLVAEDLGETLDCAVTGPGCTGRQPGPRRRLLLPLARLPRCSGMMSAARSGTSGAWS